MKRLSPLMTLVIGLSVGLSVGAALTAAVGDQIRMNYDQIVGQAGETTITRGKLAEYCIARIGWKVAPELQEQAVLEEALRTSGFTVTDAEVQARIDLLTRYAADNELARQQLEAYPQNVLREKLRAILLSEKALHITITAKEAEDFYLTYPGLFFSKPMAKLICIATTNLTEARRAMQRLRDGEDPSKLSAMLSTNEKIREVKGDVGYQTRDRVNSSKLAEQIFDANDGKGLKPGQYTEPIEIVTEFMRDKLGPDGRTIIRPDGKPEKEVVRISEHWIAYVADFKQSKTPRLEEVRDVAALLARGTKLQQTLPKWIAQQRQQITVKWVKDFDDPAAELQVVSPPPPPRDTR